MNELVERNDRDQVEEEPRLDVCQCNRSLIRDNQVALGVGYRRKKCQDHVNCKADVNHIVNDLPNSGVFLSKSYSVGQGYCNKEQDYDNPQVPFRLPRMF